MTGKELDRGVQRELGVLEPDNAEQTAKHLEMASRYLEVDPAFAFAHAQAAVRRAGRVAVVREAAGVAAYVAEDFETALRELRTHRRMTGSAEHLALLVDSERAVGRAEKALQTAAEGLQEELTAAQRVEVAMVVSGIHQDRNDAQAALAALEIPELDRNRAFSYSPRLFEAYAEALRTVGRRKDAEAWDKRAVIAEAALGQGQFAEPEIYEIEVLPDPETDQTAEEQGVDISDSAESTETTETGAERPAEEASEAARAAVEDMAEEGLAKDHSAESSAVAEAQDSLDEGSLAQDAGQAPQGAEEVPGSGLEPADDQEAFDAPEEVDAAELAWENPGDPAATDESVVDAEDALDRPAEADEDPAPLDQPPAEIAAVEEDAQRSGRGIDGEARDEDEDEDSRSQGQALEERD